MHGRSRHEETSHRHAKKPKTHEAQRKSSDSNAPGHRTILKTVYKREAGRTHPDKWIGKPEAIRQAMEAEYKNIQEAYRRLKE